jgi:hypothetical protein
LNRIKDPEVKSYNHGILDKGAKSIGKTTASSTNGARRELIIYMQKSKTRPYLLPYKKSTPIY